MSMEWLGLALLPLLMCGAMCIGGAILAFLGLRSARRPSCHTPEPTDHADPVEDYSLERH